MTAASTPLPTLVLLPPLGHDATLYDALATSLRGRVRVVAIDYPGFGRRAAVPFDYEAPAVLERLVVDIEGALRADGAVPDVIGGVSLGGTLALRIRHRAAQVSRAPALLAMSSGGLPVARVRREAVAQAIDALGPAEFARTHLGLGASTLEGSGFEAHLGRRTSAVSAYFAHFVESTWAPADFEARAHAAAAMLRAALDVDYRDAMASVRTPAAIVWGDADRVFRRRHIDRLCAAIPGAQLHVLSGVGHFPPLEDPASVAEAAASLFVSATDNRGIIS